MAKQANEPMQRARNRQSDDLNRDRSCEKKLAELLRNSILSERVWLTKKLAEAKLNPKSVAAIVAVVR